MNKFTRLIGISLLGSFSHSIYALDTGAINWYDKNPQPADTCVGDCEPKNYFEVIAAGGVGKLNIANTDIVVNGDTGTIVNNNTDWKTYIGQFGVGYVFSINNPPLDWPTIVFFRSIEPQLNIYYSSSNDILGDVSGFTDSANDFESELTFRNTRFMLDIALTTLSWHSLSVYVKGGIGVAWSRIFFDEQNTVDPTTEVNLESRSSNNFVWEVGAGFSYMLDFHSKITINLEYLYTDFGKMKAGDSDNAVSVVPPEFTIPSQVLLLGLRVPVY